jgi:hypothetical protein
LWLNAITKRKTKYTQNNKSCFHFQTSLSKKSKTSCFTQEPLIGIEPTTYSLQMNCTTVVLQWLASASELPHQGSNLEHSD